MYQSYDDVAPYQHLDRVVCQWRRAEDERRELCGLPSVKGYSGCFPYSRGHTDSPIAPPTVSPKPTESPPSIPPVIYTESPSRAPVWAISLPPVVPEVIDPVSPFTDAPVVPPTKLPSLLPTTDAPVIPGTPAPLLSLTSAPVSSATPAPVVPLTSVPVATATPAPVVPVTPDPVASATQPPVVPVTSAPVTSVTEAPIVLPATAAPVAAAATADPSTNTVSQGRYLRTGSANDVIRDNYSKEGNEKRRIEMDEINFRGADWTDQQWEEWIEDMYRDDKNLEQIQEEERELLEGNQLSFHSYQFLIDVRTEYYFRYSGTQTVPPCYGPYTANTRGNTNHWRILKDPIRVHPRQIAEMERLLKNRIAPPDDPFNACQVDTAGVIDEEGHISVARPLQDFSYGHYESFCECKDWPSKWPEDRAWCEIKDIQERFYDHPYHFKTAGF
jgi:Eukaryotic-type carbonic anhydrase